MTTDVRLPAGFLKHPKTQKLRLRFGADAVLDFMRLWLFCAETVGRHDGDLSRMDDLDIAIACNPEMKEPKAWVEYLAELGFLDGPENSRLIHDWAIHQPWVAKKGERQRAAQVANMVRWHKDGKHPEHVDGCPLCEHRRRTMSAADGKASESEAKTVRPGADSQETGDPPTPLPSPPLLSSPHLSPPNPTVSAASSSIVVTPAAEDIVAGRFDSFTVRKRKSDTELLHGIWCAFVDAWPRSRRPRAFNKARVEMVKTALHDYRPSDVTKALLGVARDRWWRGELAAGRYEQGPPNADKALAWALGLESIESAIELFEGVRAKAGEEQRRRDQEAADEALERFQREHDPTLARALAAGQRKILEAATKDEEKHDRDEQQRAARKPERHEQAGGDDAVRAGDQRAQQEDGLPGHAGVPRGGKRAG